MIPEANLYPIQNSSVVNPTRFIYGTLSGVISDSPTQKKRSDAANRIGPSLVSWSDFALRGSLKQIRNPLPLRYRTPGMEHSVPVR